MTFSIHLTTKWHSCRSKPTSTWQNITKKQGFLRCSADSDNR